MGHFKKVGIIITILIIVSIITQSCCKGSIEIVGNGSIYTYNKSNNGRVKTDTIKGETHIDWYPETDVVSNTSFNLIKSAYATTCNRKFINTLVDSTLAISCNKKFMYNDSIIDAGTNFIGIKELESFVNSRNAFIRFNNDFIHNVGFEKTEYEFEVRVTTTDNLELVNTVKLISDL